FDAMLKQRIRPFVEIGFMPKALAADPSKTVFWWKGYVSRPKDWNRWQDLVTAFVNHLTQRFGRDEILKWNFEVWNEPDNAAFFPVPKGQDRKAAYFELYDKTARAVKKADPAYRVGGPSLSWVKSWITEFITDCTTHGTPLDFITFHSYGLDGLQGGLDPAGSKRYFISPDPLGQANAIGKQAPSMIAKSARPELPIHVTEWNTSYAKLDHVHDSYYNAAIMLGQLRHIEKNTKSVASVARWTFTDIFEEDGLPPAPFWGGFGIITIDGIKKASFFAFKYLAALGDTELVNADKQSWVCRDAKGGVQVLFYDLTYPMKEPLKHSNNEFFGQVHPPLAEAPAKFALTQLPPGSYQLTVHQTGFQKNDAFTRYLELGSPKKLTPVQLAELNALASDQPVVDETIRVAADGRFERTFNLRSNDIVFLSLAPLPLPAR
ncbi:MAG: hypothetical protein H7067_17005, partial [Burkholderiales bacterium]|nr:hypothetical protein [Opitutaceae bacterium]